MDELEKLMAELGISEEQAQKILGVSKKLVEAETEKGKGYYREKDKETLSVKQALKEKEEALSKLQEAGKSSETTLESLKGEIEALKQERDAERQAREAESAKATREAVRAELLNKLGSRVKMANHVISGILAEHEAQRSEEGYTIGGKPISSFVDEFVKQNEADLVIDQKSGSGGDRGNHSSNDWTKMSLAELKQNKIIE